MTGLAGPIASLTSGIQSLTRIQEQAQAETRRMRSELPGAMREELHAPLRELTDTVKNLTKVLKEMQQNHASVNPAIAPRPFLWNVPSESQASPEGNRSEKTKSWPRWPRRFPAEADRIRIAMKQGTFNSPTTIGITDLMTSLAMVFHPALFSVDYPDGIRGTVGIARKQRGRTGSVARPS